VQLEEQTPQLLDRYHSEYPDANSRITSFTPDKRRYHQRPIHTWAGDFNPALRVFIPERQKQKNQGSDAQSPTLERKDWPKKSSAPNKRLRFDEDNIRSTQGVNRKRNAHVDIVLANTKKRDRIINQADNPSTTHPVHSCQATFKYSGKGLVPPTEIISRVIPTTQTTHSLPTSQEYDLKEQATTERQGKNPLPYCTQMAYRLRCSDDCQPAPSMGKEFG
jgi:hypothetical protein